MNCHEDNNGKQGGHKHNPLKHMLHMIICCGLPIVLLASLPLISKINPSAARLVGVIVPFLCPLMMIGMLPMMLGGNKKEERYDNTKEITETSNKTLELNKPVE